MIIKYLTEDAFVTLYIFRCHLEYANSVWNPYRQDLENVQMRATKLELGLQLAVKHLSYTERLYLPTNKYRRARLRYVNYKITIKKRSERRKHCALAENFSPHRRFHGGAGDGHYLHPQTQFGED